MKNITICAFVAAASISCLASIPVSARKPISKAPAGKSEWIHLDKNGMLEYKTTERGDRIMDFSHAGYKGGGVPIPYAKVKANVAPVADGGDCTAAIQAAIDKVSQLPIGADGLRGAVLLEPGIFPCSEAIRISADGVVLRGSGVGVSTIYMTGSRRQTAVVLYKEGSYRGGNRIGQPARDCRTVKVTDGYVPAGSRSLHVSATDGIRPGDRVEISKPVTEKWVHFMQMDDMWRDGKHQTWIAVGSRLVAERTVASVSGNEVSFTVPLADSYDAAFTNDSTLLTVIPTPDRTRNSGMEDFTIQCPDQKVNHTQALYYAITLNGEDCWVRNVTALETMESVRMGGCRLTLQNVNIIRKADHQGSSKPAEFAPNAGQVLCENCSVEGNNVWYVGVGAGQTGPIVFLNCTFLGDGHIEGHQRWSTGFLFDNCKVPGGGIDFKNRGEMGSGHGWGTAWAVAWNCEAKSYVNQLPPATLNWVIGSKGESTPLRRPFNREGPTLPVAVFDSHGEPVAPQSLYLTQLKERLGKKALKAIGY